MFKKKKKIEWTPDFNIDKESWDEKQSNNSFVLLFKHCVIKPIQDKFSKRNEYHTLDKRES